MPTTVAAAFEQMLADPRLPDRPEGDCSGRARPPDHFYRRNYQLDTGPGAIGSYNRETLIRWERDVDEMIGLSVAAYWERYKGRLPAAARLGSRRTQPGVQEHARWRATNPPFHQDLVEAWNVRLASRLKPLVRLMKAWNNANDTIHYVRSMSR